MPIIFFQNLFKNLLILLILLLFKKYLLKINKFLLTFIFISAILQIRKFILEKYCNEEVSL